MAGFHRIQRNAHAKCASEMRKRNTGKPAWDPGLRPCLVLQLSADPEGLRPEATNREATNREATNREATNREARGRQQERPGGRSSGMPWVGLLQ